MPIQVSTAAPPIAGAVGAQFGTPASPAADAPVRTSAEPTDTVSLSPAAQQALHTPATADDAAADSQAVAESLQGLADHLNSFKAFLNPEDFQNVRDALGDEYAEKWLQEVKQHIDNTEKTLIGYSSCVAQTYGVSGSLPSKDADGTWSSGPFTLSRSGSDFAVRAGNDGGVQVSRNGGAYQAWTPPGQASSVTNTGPQAALKALEQITAQAKAGEIVGTQAQAQVLALFKTTA